VRQLLSAAQNNVTMVNDNLVLTRRWKDATMLSAMS